MLSQVKLCFVCPEFSFFFAKSHSIPDACSICAISLPSCKYTAGYISSLLFLLSSSLAQLPTPRAHHSLTTNHKDVLIAMMQGEHYHATYAGLPSGVFFFFSFLFFMLMSSFVVQSPWSLTTLTLTPTTPHMVQQPQL